MSNFAAFQGQRFLNLETYRKNGTAVQTPVGFVEDGATLLVRTQISAWKVKRMRANPKVRIVPSTGRGEARGDWQEARAQELSVADSDRARALFLRRYGLIWWFLEIARPWLRRGDKIQWTTFRLTPTEGLGPLHDTTGV